MSHWNYRLCKTTHPNKTVSYEIHEAYYNQDGSIWAVTGNPITVSAFIEPEIYEDTEQSKLVELRRTVDWIKMALDKEIIDLDTQVFTELDSSDEEDDDGEDIY